MSSRTGRPLSGHDLEAFLDLGLVARLSCLDDRGWPYIVPVWYQWDGSRFWILGAEHAKWVGYVQASQRVALCIDEPKSLSRVLCQGVANAQKASDAQRLASDIARTMVTRYMGEEAVAEYERATQGLVRWLVIIDVNRLITWRGLGRADAAETGTQGAGQ